MREAIEDTRREAHCQRKAARYPEEMGLRGFRAGLSTLPRSPIAQSAEKEWPNNSRRSKEGVNSQNLLLGPCRKQASSLTEKQDFANSPPGPKNMVSSVGLSVPIFAPMRIVTPGQRTAKRSLPCFNPRTSRGCDHPSRSPSLTTCVSILAPMGMRLHSSMAPALFGE
jgi:hypothetical protein